MRDISKIKTAVLSERMMMPACNSDKFMKEAESYLAEMTTADDERGKQLCDELWKRTCWLKEHGASTAPPLLCRRIGESNDDYLNRIYQEGGYYAG